MYYVAGFSHNVGSTYDKLTITSETKPSIFVDTKTTTGTPMHRYAQPDLFLALTHTYYKVTSARPAALRSLSTKATPYSSRRVCSTVRRRSSSRRSCLRRMRWMGWRRTCRTWSCSRSQARSRTCEECGSRNFSEVAVRLEREAMSLAQVGFVVCKEINRSSLHAKPPESRRVRCYSRGQMMQKEIVLPDSMSAG